MHSCQDIEENRCFSNGGTNLHIHTIAQGRPEDNQVEYLQGPHGIVNPQKNLVLKDDQKELMQLHSYWKIGIILINVFGKNNSWNCNLV